MYINPVRHAARPGRTTAAVLAGTLVATLLAVPLAGTAQAGNPVYRSPEREAGREAGRSPSRSPERESGRSRRARSRTPSPARADRVGAMVRQYVAQWRDGGGTPVRDLRGLPARMNVPADRELGVLAGTELRHGRVIAHEFVLLRESTSGEVFVAEGDDLDHGRSRMDPRTGRFRTPEVSSDRLENLYFW